MSRVQGNPPLQEPNKPTLKTEPPRSIQKEDNKTPKAFFKKSFFSYITSVRKKTKVIYLKYVDRRRI